jgi:hypothetical protein
LLPLLRFSFTRGRDAGRGVGLSWIKTSELDPEEGRMCQ